MCISRKLVNGEIQLPVKILQFCGTGICESASSTMSASFEIFAKVSPTEVAGV